MKRFTIFSLIIIAGVAASADDQDARIAFFETKIRPVLAEHCYGCHSNAAQANGNLKGGLTLDSREGMQLGGDTGPAVTPSNPAGSLILAALRHEGELKMPMKKPKLSDAIIGDFTKWIEMGAPDPRHGKAAHSEPAGLDIGTGKSHWAFQPLRNPAAPGISGKTWARTDIDRFIRAKLESKGIAPNVNADPRQLVRRAYFDLIGLPPTPEQVNHFLVNAEGGFDKAWGQLIDELLASPHYGERWGRHWLDLVRFAESNGYAFDRDRPNAWRYRDWVIQSLNADMPYDKFVRLQITGDLVAGKDRDTSEKAERALELISATGFIVGGPFTTQQTQKERERSRYEQLDDVIHTLGTSMLGLTVGCARCHDHKYDPIGSHDYYELAAMFSDVGFDDIGIDLKPHIYREAKAAYDAVHNPLVKALDDREKEITSDLAVFIAEYTKASEAVTLSPWHSIGPFAAGDFNKAFADPFGPEIGFKLDVKESYEVKKGKDKVENRTWTPQPTWKDGEVHNAVLKGGNSAFYLQREITSPRAQSIGLSVSGNDGIKIWINGYKVGEEKRGGDAKADELKVHLPLVKGKNSLFVKIANGGGDAGFYFQTALDKDRTPKAVDPILKLDQSKWNDAQKKTIFDWFKPHDRTWTELNAMVATHQYSLPQPELTKTYAAKPRGNTYQFGENTYKVFHLHRGNTDNKKDLARPGFLRVLSRRAEKHWLGVADPVPDERWTVLTPVSAKGKTTKLQLNAKGVISVTGERPPKDTYSIELDIPAQPTKVTAIRILVPATQASNFVLSQVSAKWIPAKGEPEDLEFDTAVANFEQSGFKAVDVLAGTFSAAKGWAISGGVGKENELVLIGKNPLEFNGGGKLQLTLVQESQWAQHLITSFSCSVTGAADVRDWAAQKDKPVVLALDQVPPREALADWLTDSEEGAGSLLSRVIVNRIWKHHFGRGIVATPSDFGTRGEKPTHPELLDWLARELLDNEWRLKPVHRAIMTSSVYMQSGADVAGGLANDPENMLFWRSQSRRLEAEAIRDNLLSVSGKLNTKFAGKGDLNPMSPQRSVYLTVKRGQLIEMLQLFDAPDAMQSIGNREVSTVAPQALAILNSTAVRNWASDLAKRAKPSKETTIEQALETAYQISYGRPPRSDERVDMIGFIERQTKARGGSIDLAFRDVCHLLLCANEFVYID